jgi:hypothetical protein
MKINRNAVGDFLPPDKADVYTYQTGLTSKMLRVATEYFVRLNIFLEILYFCGVIFF